MQSVQYNLFLIASYKYINTIHNMIKVFQICVDGVGTDRSQEAETVEEAIKDCKKDCIEEYEKNFSGKSGVAVFSL